MANVLYVESQNLIVVQGLYNNNSQGFVNNATIEITLLDAGGNEVDGVSWPLEANYVTGSDGRYHVVIPGAAEISLGAAYEAKITATLDSELIKTWWLDLVAIQDRRC